MMEYKVKIDAFEGPLDLLLHLLKEAKLSIEEIRISEITEQYLNYIHAMEVLRLEIASEYLVMAATLMEIKSKSLLPKQVIEIDGEYEENSQEALIERLRAYQQYKEVTKEFRELEASRGKIYTKPPIDFSPYVDSHVKLAQDFQIEDLISAFEKLMRRHQLMKPLKTKIMSQNVSIDQRILTLKRQLQYKTKVAFSALFEQWDKEYIVVTFLALLELVKSAQITLVQQSYQEDIYISSLEGDQNA